VHYVPNFHEYFVPISDVYVMRKFLWVSVTDFLSLWTVRCSASPVAEPMLLEIYYTDFGKNMQIYEYTKKNIWIAVICEESSPSIMFYSEIVYYGVSSQFY
jgi:hypothetical protein